MQQFRAELDDAVAGLQQHCAELRQASAERLGSLYSAGGVTRCLYDEALDLAALGRVTIARGSTSNQTRAAAGTPIFHR